MPEYIVIDGMRFHQTDIGLIPGVTTVLSNTKSQKDLEGLKWWRRKVGKIEADRVLKAASDRGTKLHKAIEDTLTPLEEHPIDLDEEISVLYSQFQQVEKDLGETLFIEKDLYHPLGYAGTADLIAEYKGELTVIDWKTANKPKKPEYIKDYLLQVAAYIQAANFVLNLDIKQGLVAVFCAELKKAQLFTVSSEDYPDKVKEFNKRLLLFQSQFNHNF